MFMKKNSVFILILCIFCVTKHAVSQRLFSLNEMAQIASYQDHVSFGKYLATQGYLLEDMPSTMRGIKEFYSYKDRYTKADGTANTCNWTIFDDKNGLHKYVSFGFSDKDHFNSIMKTLMARGYALVKNQQKDLGGGYVSLGQYLRKGKVGILATITDEKIQNSKSATFEIAFTIISTPNWPVDEINNF